MGNGQGARQLACFESAPTFLVSKFTQRKLESKAPETAIQFSLWEKGSVVSRRAVRCDDTEASFEL